MTSKETDQGDKTAMTMYVYVVQLDNGNSGIAYLTTLDQHYIVTMA